MNTISLLESYGITSVYHFTDKSNLENIEKYGIQSLKNLKINNIQSTYGANELSHNLDRQKGLDRFVHLSFVKDHPMYHSAKKRGNLITPVWIELDISILLNDKTFFSDKVANSYGAKIFKIDDILKYIDIQNLFNYNDFLLGKETRKAEIMVNNYIPTNKILGVSYGK